MKKTEYDGGILVQIQVHSSQWLGINGKKDFYSHCCNYHVTHRVFSLCNDKWIFYSMLHTECTLSCERKVFTCFFFYYYLLRCTFKLHRRAGTKSQKGHLIWRLHVFVSNISLVVLPRLRGQDSEEVRIYSASCSSARRPVMHTTALCVPLIHHCVSPVLLRHLLLLMKRSSLLKQHICVCSLFTSESPEWSEGWRQWL